MKPRATAVLGHVIPEPRPTAWAVAWLVVWVVLPVTAAGAALDLLAQWLFGVCTGLWCVI